MVFYQCYRCGYSNNDKSKIRYHINRKNPCEYSITDISLDECKKAILQGLSYEKYLKSIDVPEKSTPGQQKNTNNSLIGQHKNTNKSTKCEYKCQFCEKILSYKQSYYRHLKTCNDKKQEDEVNESMTELVSLLNEQIIDYKKELKKKDNELEKRDKHIEKRDKQIDELIKKAGINNSTITQNIQNNIKLLAYKDTDVSKLTDKDILNCMNHSNMCVPHLIKLIHLDPKKPENHNIYISNLPQA